MTPKRVVVRGLSAVVVIIAAVVIVSIKTQAPAEAPDAGGLTDAGQTPAAIAARAEQPAPVVPTVPRERRLAPSARKLLVDKETRAAMLAKILTRLNASQHGAAAPSAEALAKDSAPPKEAALAGREDRAEKGSLSKEYIQQQVHEIVPLIRECYEMALERNPELGGSMKVQFTIIGDEEYGGLVEDSKILEGSTLAGNADMTECVRETMYAIRLKAPEGGGRIVVNYPFIFKSKQ